MPLFSIRFPKEYIKAGSPSWFLEGFNTTTFWMYLGKSGYKIEIDDQEIVKFLDRTKILYIVDAVLIIGFMFLIEMDV